MPMTIGDLLRVSASGATLREFLVVRTTPATPVYPLQPKRTGELLMEPPKALHSDVEAVVVQAETIIRAQARGAGKSTPDRVGYEDIGGLGKELQRIREVIELPIKYPALFDRLGIEPPKGVLLYGPPGIGKTFIARAVAAEQTTAASFLINGPELIQKLPGETESSLRQVFLEAQKRAPSIIFIDELDSLAPKRTATAGEVERRIVGQLLALMDGLVPRGQVFLVGATNRLDLLDPALRRPGRFDYEIALPLPDQAGRLEILRIHSKNLALADHVDFERLAQLTPGFVGADLAALCREAAMSALRRTLPPTGYQRGYVPYETLVNLSITMADFEQALEQLSSRTKASPPPPE
jgi:transitional endoplasmic reticulum ATPase